MKFGFKWKPVAISEVEHAIKGGMTLCGRSVPRGDPYRLSHINYRMCKKCKSTVENVLAKKSGWSAVVICELDTP